MQKTIRSEESFRNFANANERENALPYVGVWQHSMARFVGGAGFLLICTGVETGFQYSTLFFSTGLKTLILKNNERKKITEKGVEIPQNIE